MNLRLCWYLGVADIAAIALLALTPPGLAQSIAPASDGTGTVVTPAATAEGSQYTITGGTTSSDGANLFHSFERFGLSPTEAALFLSDPAVQNILGRITGGDASMINGLLQVGGSANLFLINPAGILFGPNAVLNLEGSFTATTATSIGIGSSWLQAVGSNDYAALVGNPSAFAFAVDQPGAVVNGGALAVAPGQTLRLVGGSVVNTGTLSAPGGQITIQAVPGQNLVRLSQAGSPLSLELATLPLEAAPSSALPLSPLDLPALLTGAAQPVGLTPQADGSVRVAGSSVTIPAGSSSAIAAGRLDASGPVGGTIAVLGDRVAVLGGTLEATGAADGGSLYIGGAYQGDERLPAAQITVVDQGSQLIADAGSEGNGGTVVVWAADTTTFAGQISAQGGSRSGNGGSVEVSGAQDLSFAGQVDTTAANGSPGTLLLDPENIVITDGADSPDDALVGSGSLEAGGGDGTFTISAGALAQLSAETAVQLSATRDITLNDLSDDQLTFANGPGGSITFTADADSDGAGAFSMDASDEILAPGRGLTFSGASLSLGALNTAAADGDLGGGAIALTATRGAISARDIDSDGGTGNGGAVSLNAPNGSITVAQDIDADSSDGNGGSVTLTAGGDVSIGLSDTTDLGEGVGLDTESDGGNGFGGDINISAGGNIRVFELDSDSTGTTDRRGGGGDITLIAGGNIFVADAIDSDAAIGDGGTISLTANGSEGIVVNGAASFAAIESFSGDGNGGELRFSAPNGSVDIGSNISTEALQTGQGGRVEISAGVKISLERSISSAAIRTSALDAPGGAIALSSDWIVVEGLASSGSGGGAISLSGNEIDLTAPLTAAGAPLLLRPLSDSPGQVMVLGGTADSDPAGQETQTLDLTAADLANLGNVFSRVIFGQANGSTDIRANGNLTFQNPVDFLSPVTLGSSVSFGSIGTNEISFSNALFIGSSAVTIEAIQINLVSIEGGSGSSITLLGQTNFANGGRLVADEIDFSGTLDGVGELFIESASPSRGIALGEAAPDPNDPQLNLDAAEFASFGSSWQAIYINTGSDNEPSVAPAAILGPITTPGVDLAIFGSSLNGPGLQVGPDASIDTNGGDLRLSGTSAAGPGIVLSQQSALSSEGGAIELSGTGISSAPSTGPILSGGGPLVVEAGSSDVALPTLSTLDLLGNGNDIRIRGNTITTGSLISRGQTQAGSVQLLADTSITVNGFIDTSNATGNGGSVLLDPAGDIQVGFIDTQGGPLGVGGDVTVMTQRFFRATQATTDLTGQAASITTAGGLGGGRISIAHGGGLQVPFNIGSAALNGTAADLFSGSFRLSFNSPGNPFFGSFNLGGSGPGSLSLITPTQTTDPCDAICRAPNPVTLSGYRPPEQQPLSPLGAAVLTAVPLKAEASSAIADLESEFSAQYASYFGWAEVPEAVSLAEIQETLSTVQQQLALAGTQQVPALVFVAFGPPPEAEASRTGLDTYRLELILVTATGQPLYQQIPAASRRQVLDTAERLRRQVTDVNLVGTETYLAPAQQLYQWLIAPLAPQLEALGVTNLGFVMDAGLRSLPIAALHSGAAFLVEDYSLGLIPSMSLIDRAYVNIQTADLLIGGASQFATQSPLLAAPLEISAIQTLWQGSALVEQDFTRAQLAAQRQQQPYQIIHLATHGEFLRGDAANAYLQFFDDRLRLSQLAELGWRNPRVELVTLSACETAIGNREAELGFAGFAVGSGAKSALASLWKVSDEATAGLMIEFYQQLQRSPIKAEALRQAQLALLGGQVHSEANQLVWSGGSQPLPPLLQHEGRQDFSHPFFWAPFTLVGSPW